MGLTVGDFVAQRLDQWGVQRIYGARGKDRAVPGWSLVSPLIPRGL
jgi:hypothetical protein